MHLQKLSCSHKPIRFFAIPKNDKIDFRLHEFQRLCGHNQMIIEYPFAQLSNSDFCAKSQLALKGCVILWSDRIAWVLFKAQLQNILSVFFHQLQRLDFFLFFKKQKKKHGRRNHLLSVLSNVNRFQRIFEAPHFICSFQARGQM